MVIRQRLWVVAALLLSAAPVAGAVFHSDQFSRTLNLAPGTSLTVENPRGSISILGTDSPELKIHGTRNIQGVDRVAVNEGVKRTQIEYGGEANVRYLRTVVPFLPDQRWQSSVSYTLEVPRSTNLNIVNHSSDLLRVSNVSGNVFVKHVNGAVELTGITGLIRVSTVNGHVTVRYPSSPRANAAITSVNGTIELAVPEDSAFEWRVDSVRGEIFSSLPVRGDFLPQASGRAYRATLNGATAPKIATNAIMGKTYLVGIRGNRQQARIIQPPQTRMMVASQLPQQAETASTLQVVTRRLLLQSPSARSFIWQQPRIDGNFSFETMLGNIFVGELTGDARVITRAGEIVLGKVAGRCVTRSGGGSLHLGDIGGTLDAQTSAGDVLVSAARKGGTLATEAGNIQVRYAGGRINLYSGGGDISVRQAAAPVKAESRSGDITISMDPSVGSQPVEARSVGGNIVLNLAPGFGAEIEAIATAPVGESSPIQSEFTGLEISSERIGDRIRARATGKINGGGQRVVLTVDDGTIRLRSRILPPPTR